MENLQDLQEKLLAGIRSAAGLKELDELRVAALGKKGSITEKMKTLRPPAAGRENRRRQGAEPAEIGSGKRRRKPQKRTGND